MLKRFFCPPCLIGLVLILAVLGGYYLLKGGYQAPEEETAPVSEGEVGKVREITVSGTEYSFNPASITVSAGERVKVTFRNIGDIAHNFVVRDLGVGTKTIGGGKTDTVEFTAPQSGTYTFICSVPGHAIAGMLGDLIVE